MEDFLSYDICEVKLNLMFIY